MFPEGEGLCRGSVEALVVHGANRVCEERARWGHVTVAFVLLVVVAVALGSRLRERTRQALPILLTLAALPGLVAIGSLRADAPRQAPATAQAITVALHELRADAEGRGCARMLHGRCEACAPLGRFAVGDHAPCRGPGAPGPTPSSCRDGDRAFSCGAP